MGNNKCKDSKAYYFFFLLKQVFFKLSSIDQLGVKTVMHFTRSIRYCFKIQILLVSLIFFSLNNTNVGFILTLSVTKIINDIMSRLVS